MRNVLIKIIIQDDETSKEVEDTMTLKQFNTLAEFNLNCVNEMLPQLNRQLTEKLGHHEDIKK